MIDAVLFDLGNVLIRWDPRNHYKDRFASAEEMERFLAEIARAPGTTRWISASRSRRRLPSARRSIPQHAELLGEWKSQWERMLGGAIDESVALLAELRQAGYRIAALTNWSAETFPVARERFPFLGWFEDIVISGVEGIAKPDPAMFALALQRTGFVAERTVFIDDNLPNIEGARAIGMHTVHFSSTAQCRDELRALGVRV